MLDSYKARRKAKHEAEKRNQVALIPNSEGLIDLMPRFPRLTFINGKTHPQANGGRKNRPGHNTEWSEAMIENGGRTLAAAVETALRVSENPGVVEALAAEGLEISKDAIDECLMCGTEVPPGPDFCSTECEAKANTTSETL